MNTIRNKRLTIGDNEQCPCESGKVHLQCCKKKSFRWKRDEKGNFFREVPLSQKAMKIFKEQEQDYIRILGRKPRKNEPIMLHQYTFGPEEYDAELLRALKEAKVRPEIIYATQKTGLLLTEGNLDLAPGKDIEEWHSAINEYFELKRKRKLKLSPREVSFKALETEQYSIQLVCGMFLRGLWSKKSLSYMQQFPMAHFFLSICSIKIFRLLKTIRNLHDANIGGESLGIVRSLFECYVQYSYISRFPEKAEDFLAPQVGVLSGKYEFCKNKEGKSNRKKLIHLPSGRIVTVLSNFQIMSEWGSEIDMKIFDYLYDYLSEAVHLDVNYMVKVFDGDGLNYNKIIEIDESVKLTTFVMLLVLDEFSGISSQLLKKDIFKAGDRIRRILLKYLKHEAVPNVEVNLLIEKKLSSLFEYNNRKTPNFEKNE